MKPHTRIEPLALSLVGHYGPDRVLLGINQYAARIIYDRSNPTSPHVQVSGSTGGGKGGFVRTMIAHDLRVGNEVIILEPKPGEFGWTAGAASRARTPAGMLAALRYAKTQMLTRQTMLADHTDPVTGVTGLANIGELPKHERPHRIVIYFDEARSVVGEDASLEKAERIQARADTALIAEQGRSAGVHLVILTQNPLADNYGDGATGGTLRRNLKARVHFDRDGDALTMVFKGAANRIPDSALTYAGAGIPGRAIYVYLDPADGGRPTAGQMWFLQPEQALKIARLYRGPQPRTFDTPTRVTEYR